MAAPTIIQVVFRPQHDGRGLVHIEFEGGETRVHGIGSDLFYHVLGALIRADKGIPPALPAKKQPAAAPAPEVASPS